MNDKLTNRALYGLYKWCQQHSDAAPYIYKGGHSRTLSPLMWAARMARVHPYQVISAIKEIGAN